MCILNLLVLDFTMMENVILCIDDEGNTVINLPRIEKMPLKKREDLAYNLQQLLQTVVNTILQERMR